MPPRSRKGATSTATKLISSLEDNSSSKKNARAQEASEQKSKELDENKVDPALFQEDEEALALSLSQTSFSSTSREKRFAHLLEPIR